MRRALQLDRRTRRSPPMKSHRPMVEVLEDRLHPGDVLLGWGLLGSRLGQVTEFGANLQTEVRTVVEAPHGNEGVATSRTLIVCHNEGCGRALDSVGRANQEVDRARLAYRELSGLDEDSLDRLIADDFDGSDSLNSSFHTAAPTAGSGVPGSSEEPRSGDAQGGLSNEAESWAPPPPSALTGIPSDDGLGGSLGGTDHSAGPTP